jgi:serpin B
MKNKKVITYLALLIAIPLVFAVLLIGTRYISKEVVAPKSQDEIMDKNTNTKTKNKNSGLPVIDANNAFALDFYNKLKEEEGNIFFSPYSISEAFSMVYDGANGKTADEIASVFKFDTDEATRLFELKSHRNNLISSNDDYELNISNAFWADIDYKFRDEYVSKLKSEYGAEAQNVDFKNDSERVRLVINDWVLNKTNQKIKDLFSAEAITSDTKMVLANTIYFLGKWEYEFNTADTKKEKFFVSEEETIDIDMMNRIGSFNKYNFGEIDEMKILELEYKGDALSMLIFLPNDKDLKKLEGKINTENLNKWKNSMIPYKVNISVPKFKFETTMNLKDKLKDMGVKLAFSDSADFSKMNEGKDLFIGSAVHKAYIDVYEEGTEATAATGATMVATSIDVETPKEFRADHPFVFMIQDKRNWNILFMGRVEKP